jgi:hypothetical protein
MLDNTNALEQLILEAYEYERLYSNTQHMANFSDE